MLVRFILQHSIDYKIGKYQLTINFWFLIIFLLVQTGLNELGFWQLSRAQEKQTRIDKINRQQVSNFYSLKNMTQKMADDFLKINLNVELAESSNLLIENKIQNSQLGYHVLNLVKEKQSNKFVLVNRGWITAKAHRSELPQLDLPSKIWNIKGRLYPVNKDILSGDAVLEEQRTSLRLPVLDSRMLTLLEKRFNLDIEPYIIRLDKDVSSVYDVDWTWVSMSPEKHLAYAIQWFGLALAFLIISLFALVKKH